MSSERARRFIRKAEPGNDPAEFSKRFQLVVIGGSSGATEVITDILKRLTSDINLSIAIVKHIAPDYRDSHLYISSLNTRCALTVKEADQRETIVPGVVYLAPANYHLLIEKDRTFSLTVDEKIKFCRPAIDVLFETAAEAYGSRLIGIILSGANDDGANGSKKIKEKGGYTVVQKPETAAADTMPLAAINACEVDALLTPEEIVNFLISLANKVQT